MSGSDTRWQYVCETCGETRALTAEIWRCPSCGGALGVSGPDRLHMDAIVRERPDIWRYASVLPLSESETRGGLGEGMTPLAAASIDGRDVLLKLDSLLPTGSFKDRGASVLSRFLRSGGVRRIILDSSGNAAAAMSAFAASEGLECAVYVPATASPGKLVQARAYGASVIPVDGSREDVALAAQTAASDQPDGMYASHNWHPVFVEGVKTWAFEVWEQLGGRTPDVAFIPTGGGSALVGAWRGFSTIDDASSGLPRLVACQPVACAPIVKAWQSNEPIRPATPGQTIAEGTRIAMPSRPAQIINALSATNGAAEAVTDDEIADALRLVARQGFYLEPTAAVGVAAFRRAYRRGDIPDQAAVVVHVTGHGLKATETIASLLPG